MDVLLTTASTQTWTIIPRYAPSSAIKVYFTRESENKVSHTFTVSPAKSNYTNGFLTIENAFSPVLVEGEFDTYKVVENSGNEPLLYRGKVFVTDQTQIPKYTQNKNRYNQYSGNNNEYIIIE